MDILIEYVLVYNIRRIHQEYLPVSMMVFFIADARITMSLSKEAVKDAEQGQQDITPCTLADYFRVRLSWQRATSILITRYGTDVDVLLGCCRNLDNAPSVRWNIVDCNDISNIYERSVEEALKFSAARYIDGKAKAAERRRGRAKEEKTGSKRKGDFNKDMETRRLNGEVAREKDRERKREETREDGSYKGT